MTHYTSENLLYYTPIVLFFVALIMLKMWNREQGHGMGVLLFPAWLLLAISWLYLTFIEKSIDYSSLLRYIN
jgi:hypothetical protein